MMGEAGPGMVRFVCDYRLDENVMREYMRAAQHQSVFPRLNLILLIVSVVLSVFVLIFQTDPVQVFFGIFILAAFGIILIRMPLTYRRWLKTMRERLNSSGVAPNDVTRAFISDTECVLRSLRRQDVSTLRMDAVKDHYESRDRFFVIFEGNIFLALEKAGFLQGTPDQFRVFLSGYPRRKNRKPIIMFFILLYIVCFMGYLLRSEILMSVM